MKNKTVFVTGEDVITEMITKYPEAEKVLIESGMHCLGCPSATSETIEEACDVHGADCELLLEKINNFLEEGAN